MWDEDPRVHQANWRTAVWALKAAVVFAALLSLVFGIWDPLVSVLAGLASIVGVLFVAWVVPMWLLGKFVKLVANSMAHFQRKKV